MGSDILGSIRQAMQNASGANNIGQIANAVTQMQEAQTKRLLAIGELENNAAFTKLKFEEAALAREIQQEGMTQARYEQAMKITEKILKPLMAKAIINGEGIGAAMDMAAKMNLKLTQILTTSGPTEARAILQNVIDEVTAGMKAGDVPKEVTKSLTDEDLIKVGTQRPSLSPEGMAAYRQGTAAYTDFVRTLNQQGMNTETLKDIIPFKGTNAEIGGESAFGINKSQLDLIAKKGVEVRDTMNNTRAALMREVNLTKDPARRAVVQAQVRSFDKSMTKLNTLVDSVVDSTGQRKDMGSPYAERMLLGLGGAAKKVLSPTSWDKVYRNRTATYSALKDIVGETPYGYGRTALAGGALGAGLDVAGGVGMLGRKALATGGTRAASYGFKNAASAAQTEAWKQGAATAGESFARATALEETTKASQLAAAKKLMAAKGIETKIAQQIAGATPQQLNSVLWRKQMAEKLTKAGEQVVANESVVATAGKILAEVAPAKAAATKQATEMAGNLASNAAGREAFGALSPAKGSDYLQRLFGESPVLRTGIGASAGPVGRIGVHGYDALTGGGRMPEQSDATVRGSDMNALSRGLADWAGNYAAQPAYPTAQGPMTESDMQTAAQQAMMAQFLTDAYGLLPPTGQGQIGPFQQVGPTGEGLPYGNPPPAQNQPYIPTPYEQVWAGYR